MDEYLKNMLKVYADLANTSDDPAEVVHRYDKDKGGEGLIADDIFYKLRVTGGKKVLDIGCGCGGLTREILKKGKDLGVSLTLLDIPEVIENLERNLGDYLYDGAHLVKGIFPGPLESPLPFDEYDAILFYGVLHCTGDPNLLVKGATDIISSRGRVLLGDLPNVHKKGRFLASEYGRKFDANYKNVPVDEVPKYSNAEEFVQNNPTPMNEKISDDFSIDILKQYRSQGFHVYLLDQSEILPFCYTREDILIERP